jgi:hypothetical protein
MLVAHQNRLDPEDDPRATLKSFRVSILPSDRSTIFKKSGASEYAKKIYGLHPARRLRFTRPIGVRLSSKFYPRLRNAQKCLLHLLRSYRLRDKPALARTPSTSHGIGHGDSPS